MNRTPNQDQGRPSGSKQDGNKAPNPHPILRVFGLGFSVAFISGAIILFFWFTSFWQAPLAESLDLASVPTHQVPVLPGSTVSPEDQTSISIPNSPPISSAPPGPPLCGNQTEWLVLMAGLDYQEPDPGYLYGMADVIRIARVDFTGPTVNVVSLPRALLVDVPESIHIQNPVLINEAYFFGARGMGHYTGSGYGAGSLAETLKYNFGLTIDHYLVINFKAFVTFIDAIGGIDIDLPTYIDDRPTGYFEAGKQHMDGARTLYLARIREKYSDLVRINDQSMIIGAIFQRLKDPAILAKFPAIYASLKDSVITDVSPSQIEAAFCLLKKMSGADLHFYDPGWDLMVYDWEYIPTVSKKMDIFRWDQRLVDWLYLSLWSK
jgi:LCP family protein required for cell wall assembly